MIALVIYLINKGIVQAEVKTSGNLLIYGGSANRISTALQIDIKDSENLLSNYFNMFPELEIYINRISTLAKYQKWVECPVTRRRYFVSESNAKNLSDDNSIARKACNAIIQGLAAIMSKRAAWYVNNSFDLLNDKYAKDIESGNHGRLVGIIHDELLAYIPTPARIIDIKKIKGEFIPVYEFSNLAREYAMAQEEGMKRAMNELLHPLVPDFPSKADCKLGTSWAAK